MQQIVKCNLCGATQPAEDYFDGQRYGGPCRAAPVCVGTMLFQQDVLQAVCVGTMLLQQDVLQAVCVGCGAQRAAGGGDTPCGICGGRFVIPPAGVDREKLAADAFTQFMASRGISGPSPGQVMGPGFAGGRHYGAGYAAMPPHLDQMSAALLGGYQPGPSVWAGFLEPSLQLRAACKLCGWKGPQQHATEDAMKDLRGHLTDVHNAALGWEDHQP